MSFADRYSELFRRFLPSPFTIAVLLTVVAILMALLLTSPPADYEGTHLIRTLGFWKKGFWELLTFAMQMLLMLVLGHALALSRPVNLLVSQLTFFCSTTARSAFVITISTLSVSFFNWGLGLIFGAILARKVAEYATKHNIPLNYPLIGAAGYSGLMVWHGGLSGSAPLKANEPVGGIDGFLKAQIGLEETLFSGMNVTVTLLLLAFIPLLMFWLGRQVKSTAINVNAPDEKKVGVAEYLGAEKLDHSPWMAYAFGALIILLAIHQASAGDGFRFMSPNFINFSLFGLAIVFHGSFYGFISAINKAMPGAAGIAVQFPLYAGIMGIMKYSGLVVLFSSFFVSISNDITFFIYTFFSAGIVNVFVPSGGGQWAVQGPIIVEAAEQLGVSIPKAIMALSYGDQVTNMLQPFWALPLLGITGLKAKEILPYTLLMMGVGTVIFIGCLLVF